MSSILLNIQTKIRTPTGITTDSYYKSKKKINLTSFIIRVCSCGSITWRTRIEFTSDRFLSKTVALSPLPAVSGGQNPLVTDHRATTDRFTMNIIYFHMIQPLIWSTCLTLDDSLLQVHHCAYCNTRKRKSPTR